MASTTLQNHSGQQQSEVEEATKLEKKLVHAMLNRLFKNTVSQALFNSLYPQNVQTPQFLDHNDAAWPVVLQAYRQRMEARKGEEGIALATTSAQAHTPVPQPTEVSSTEVAISNSLTTTQAPPSTISDSVWCRIHVANMSQQHFEKDTFPPFTVSITQLDGTPLPRVVEEGRTKPMTDLRVKLSVFNKWANVSTEVLKDVEFERTLKDGGLVVSDLVFQEISLKHGGFFVLVIEPIDYKSEVLSWRSGKITIQSVKTHSNKKRKKRSGADNSNNRNNNRNNNSNNTDNSNTQNSEGQC